MILSYRQMVQALMHILLLNILNSEFVSSFSIQTKATAMVQRKHISHHHHQQIINKTRPITSLYAFWPFGGDKKKDDSDGTKNNSSSSSMSQDPSSGLGTTANTMENFKQSQELGKRTNALLQDLSSITIEGVAMKGKVKVFLNGQQKPVGVEIDEDFLKETNAEDLNESLTVAMQDAWGKSLSTMQDKMQSLYSELGLPSSK